MFRCSVNSVWAESGRLWDNWNKDNSSKSQTLKPTYCFALEICSVCLSAADCVFLTRWSLGRVVLYLLKWTQVTIFWTKGTNSALFIDVVPLWGFFKPTAAAAARLQSAPPAATEAPQRQAGQPPDTVAVPEGPKVRCPVPVRWTGKRNEFALHTQYPAWFARNFWLMG